MKSKNAKKVLSVMMALCLTVSHLPAALAVGDLGAPADQVLGDLNLTEPEPEESGEPADSTESTEPEESKEPAEPTESGEPEESKEPAEPAESGEPEESKDPAEPTESGEPTVACTEHSWVYTETIEEATCMGAGSASYECANCEATTTMAVDPTGHTAGEDGLCSVCGNPVLEVALLTASEQDFTWDEATKTLTWTGEAFSPEIFTDAAMPFYGEETRGGTEKRPTVCVTTEAETLVLDNPAMVTTGYQCDDVKYSLDFSIVGVKRIEVRNAAKIGEKTFNYTLAGVEEIDIENVGSIGQFAFVGDALWSKNAQLSLTIKDVGEVNQKAFTNNGDPRKFAQLTVENVNGLLRLNAEVDGNLTIKNVGTLDGYVGAKELTLENVEVCQKNTSDDQRKTSAKPEVLRLKNVGLVKGEAFSSKSELTAVYIDGANTVIEPRAFYSCSKLEKLEVTACATIESDAFKSCMKLTDVTIPDSTALGGSDTIITAPNLYDRMTNIMAGQFSMDPAEASGADTVTLEQDKNYTSSKVGKENKTDANGTQITKSASWSNKDKTVAEVAFQFRYAQEQGMDFLFVLDHSASMFDLEQGGKDSRYFVMKSKVLDVAGELLSAEGYDNRVAVTSFGGYSSTKNPGIFESVDFTADADAFIAGLNGLTAPDSMQNTDYITALKKATELVEGRNDTSRQVVVIFISDGSPTVDANNGLYVPQGESQGFISKKPYVGEEQWNTKVVPAVQAAADKLKATGARIIGVAQSVPENQQDTCKQIMEIVCTNGEYYAAKDVEGFSRAVNDAVAAAYTSYTVTDVVDPDFTLKQDTIKVSSGHYTVGTNDDGNTVITWTVEGLPYTTHTMTYQADLKEKNGTYPTGKFDTNEGDALVTEGGETVNQVETPVLEREDTTTPGGGTTPTPIPSDDPEDDGDDEPLPSPSTTPTDIPEETVPMTEIPEETVPLAEIPEELVELVEEDVPLAETPDEFVEIEEEDVPLADAPSLPQTGLNWLPAILLAVGGVSSSAAGLLLQRKKDEDEE